MDPRLMDIISALGGFIIFVILLVYLPLAMTPAIAYVIAIVIFMAVMSGAGYMINRSSS
jgi:uncharacterized membrane protein YfcA